MIALSPSQLSFHAARLIYRYTPPRFPGRWRIGRVLSNLVARIELPRQVVVRSRDGFWIAVDASDFIQREIYLYREWEPHVCGVMRRLLRPDDVFVDVGANIGYLTLYAATLIGPRGRVLSFEPTPCCCAQLIANLNLNRIMNVTLFPIGLSDHHSNNQFYLDSGENSGAGSIRKGPQSAQAIEIEVECLDEVLRRAAVDRVAMVKIDVEGAEMLVLKGMKELLSRPDGPAIVCEISEWSLQQLGYSKEAIFALMSSCGYEVEVISPVRRSIYSSESVHFQYDVLFTKRLQSAA
jgi:FkbM family methyltransferase